MVVVPEGGVADPGGLAPTVVGTTTAVAAHLSFKFDITNLAPSGTKLTAVQSLRCTKSKAAPFKLVLKSENGITTFLRVPSGFEIEERGWYDESTNLFVFPVAQFGFCY